MLLHRICRRVAHICAGPGWTAVSMPRLHICQMRVWQRRGRSIHRQRAGPQLVGRGAL